MKKYNIVMVRSSQGTASYNLLAETGEVAYKLDISTISSSRQQFTYRTGDGRVALELHEPVQLFQVGPVLLEDRSGDRLFKVHRLRGSGRDIDIYGKDDEIVCKLRALEQNTAAITNAGNDEVGQVKEESGQKVEITFDEERISTQIMLVLSAFVRPRAGS